MKPLIVLLSVTGIALVIIKLTAGSYNWSLSARIGMTVMLLITAIGHFAFTKGMEMMVPEFIPFKKEMVWATGLIEIAAAIGLLIPSLKSLTGWLLILFFVLLLPANIRAAMQHINYEKGTLDGPGSNYLWFRVPLQLLFIAWVYWSAIRF